MGKRVDNLQSVVPQRRNANRHTQRGMGELETSIRERGWIGAITAAANGETFDGSARREVLAAIDLEDAIIIRGDGSKPVVYIREDIPDADDPRAKLLALEANKIAADNLDWDASVIAALGEEGIDLSGMFRDDEMAVLLATQPTDGDWAGALGLPYGDRVPFQQMTFTVSDEQAEQIKAALDKAKGMAPFLDTGNENSNGNALARVCEVFLGRS